MQGDYDRALQDYGQAIGLEPTNAVNYRQRGLVFFDQGDFKAAAVALLRATELEADASNMIWRYLARERAGESGATELEANAARLKSNDWPRPVIELYLGKISPVQLLSIADKPEQRCEAQFYIGELSLLQGDRASAANAFQAVTDTCPKLSFEYVAAVAELKRMTEQTGDGRPAN
jgi:lipoprotein NlpI